jgi:cytochrome P450
LERRYHVTDLADRVQPTPQPPPQPQPPPRLQLLDAIAAVDAAVVRQEIAGRPVVFVNEPDLIRELLVAGGDSFEKSEFQRRVMGAAEGSDTGLGNGMLTSSNAVNRRQRTLMTRIFAQPAMRRYVRDVATLAREQRDEWAGGASVELGSAFMRLSARIVARTLFSWELGPSDEHIVDDLDMIGSLLGRPAGQREAGWANPSVIERPAAHVERRLLSLVAQRRREGRSADQDADDVLDVLLAAQAADEPVDGDGDGTGSGNGYGNGYGLTDQQIRDDLMTLFITGAENPRNSLTWALYLLARHPDAARRVAEEVDAAGAGDGYITPEILRLLPFTMQVFKEALRLYPPGYAFGRRATEDIRIGSLTLERGAEVVISPYALHRRPSLFERPGEFLPERFERDREAGLLPYSYLPFGAGPRSCIGGGFALLEGHVSLAVLLGGLSFRPVSDAVVPAEPRMTLRPGAPVWMFVEARATPGGSPDA